MAELESERLAALSELAILDTEPEEAFDGLVRLASRIAGVPTALVSLLDGERQWFKARVGLDVCSTGRDVAFCEQVVQAEQELEVPDARRDPRFAGNPLVTGHPHIVFYAGFPLALHNGLIVGTLCVIGYEPQVLDDEQRDGLRVLARQAGTRLDLRRRTAEQADTSEFLNAVLAASPDFLFVTDVHTGASTYCSPGKRLLGWTSDQLTSLGPDAAARLVHPQDLNGLKEANTLAQDLADGEVLQTRYRARQIDGKWRWLSRHITPFHRDPTGRVSQVLDISRDVTDLVQTERALTQAALHDPLTGLPNRLLLNDRLTAALLRAGENGGKSRSWRSTSMASSTSTTPPGTPAATPS